MGMEQSNVPLVLFTPAASISDSGLGASEPETEVGSDRGPVAISVATPPQHPAHPGSDVREAGNLQSRTTTPSTAAADGTHSTAHQAPGTTEKPSTANDVAAASRIAALKEKLGDPWLKTSIEAVGKDLNNGSTEEISNDLCALYGVTDLSEVKQEQTSKAGSVFYYIDTEKAKVIFRSLGMGGRAGTLHAMSHYGNTLLLNFLRKVYGGNCGEMAAAFEEACMYDIRNILARKGFGNLSDENVAKIYTILTDGEENARERFMQFFAGPAGLNPAEENDRKKLVAAFYVLLIAISRREQAMAWSFTASAAEDVPSNAAFYRQLKEDTKRRILGFMGKYCGSMGEQRAKEMEDMLSKQPTNAATVPTDGHA
jgi:hypothetical protein